MHRYINWPMTFFSAFTFLGMILILTTVQGCSSSDLREQIGAMEVEEKVLKAYVGKLGAKVKALTAANETLIKELEGTHDDISDLLTRRDDMWSQTLNWKAKAQGYETTLRAMVKLGAKALK